MKHESREQFEFSVFTVKQPKPETSRSPGWIARIFKRLFEPAFDPTMLSEEQRRDIGIDKYEVERYKALHQPLIRENPGSGRL